MTDDHFYIREAIEHASGDDSGRRNRKVYLPAEDTRQIVILEKVIACWDKRRVNEYRHIEFTNLFIKVIEPGRIKRYAFDLRCDRDSPQSQTTDCPVQLLKCLFPLNHWSLSQADKAPRVLSLDFGKGVVDEPALF